MRQFTELDSIAIEGVALEHEESISKQTVRQGFILLPIGSCQFICTKYNYK